MEPFPLHSPSAITLHRFFCWMSLMYPQNGQGLYLRYFGPVRPPKCHTHIAVYPPPPPGMPQSQTPGRAATIAAAVDLPCGPTQAVRVLRSGGKGGALLLCPRAPRTPPPCGTRGGGDTSLTHARPQSTHPGSRGPAPKIRRSAQLLAPTSDCLNGGDLTLALSQQASGLADE